MPDGTDQRAPRPDRATAARRAELRRLAAELSTDDLEISIARYDVAAGMPALIRVRRRSPHGDDEHPGVVGAMEHAHRLRPLLGLSTACELVPEPDAPRGDVVRLRQELLGLPVLDGHLTVYLTPSGVPGDTSSSAVPVPEPPSSTPTVDVSAAAASAALAVGLETSPIDTVATLDRPRRRTVLRVAGAVVTAALVWVPAPGAVRLGWRCVVTDGGPMGVVVVDAQDGTVLRSAGEAGP